MGVTRACKQSIANPCHESGRHFRTWCSWCQGYVEHAEKAALRQALRQLSDTAKIIERRLVTGRPMGELLLNSMRIVDLDVVEEWANQLDGFSALVREALFPTDGTADGER